jgi:hypothetical protein
MPGCCYASLTRERILKQRRASALTCVSVAKKKSSVAEIFFGSVTCVMDKSVLDHSQIFQKVYVKLSFSCNQNTSSAFLMLALNFLQTLRAQPLSSEALSYSSYATL